MDQLLSDLRRTWEKGAKEYLLQAITVKKVKSETGEDVLEVIDGQQRLTTLFILLYALEHQLGNPSGPNIATGRLLYSIRHDGHKLGDLVTGWLNVSLPGPDELFPEWQAFQDAAKNEHQDGAYLQSAALRCLYEFRSSADNKTFKDTDATRKFKAYVLDNVKLLVNRVEPHIKGEVIFAALNSNRVALTECELIKGVLLTRVARRPTAGRDLRYREILERRIQLGRKWDEIQQWASREDIGSFYFATTKETAISEGMMRMLELAVRLDRKDDKHPKSEKAEVRHPLFNHIFELEDQGIIFDRLISTYNRLRDWYEKDENYHLIGYCLTSETTTAGRISLLAKLLRHETKTEAREVLLKRRRDMLRGESQERSVSQLSYPNDSHRLQNIFLALSVFVVGGNGRFDFHAYAKEGWSLEHIFPQTPFGKNASLDVMQRTEALRLLTGSEELLGEDAVKKIRQINVNDSQLGVRAEVEKVLSSVPILHQAGNLCLLSSKDNAAMGCGMFDNKRGVIRARIASGSFVPRHTYEVFSKMIVNSNGDLKIWSKADIDLHTHVIEERIAKLSRQTLAEMTA